MRKPPAEVDAVKGSDAEEVPEDLKHADPHTERRRILLRALRKMIVGTALVLVFSDPMVSVMNEMGKRTGIPAFYIFVCSGAAGEQCVGGDCGVLVRDKEDAEDGDDFVLHAARRGHSEQHVCACDLHDSDCGEGACVAVHCGDYFDPICGDRYGWMSQKKVLTLRDGLVALSLYPASVGIVAFLENVVGLD